MGLPWPWGTWSAAPWPWVWGEGGPGPGPGWRSSVIIQSALPLHGALQLFCYLHIYICAGCHTFTWHAWAQSGRLWWQSKILKYLFINMSRWKISHVEILCINSLVSLPGCHQCCEVSPQLWRHCVLAPPPAPPPAPSPGQPGPWPTGAGSPGGASSLSSLLEPLRAD